MCFLSAVNYSGYLEGKVKSTALSTTHDDKNNITMISVNVPKSLKTNFGTKVAYKADIGGVAEVITDEKSLLSKIFERVNYIMKQ